MSGGVDTAADGNLTDQRVDWIAVRLNADLTIVANSACALSRARAVQAAA
jgi:hypothetical protein